VRVKSDNGLLLEPVNRSFLCKPAVDFRR